MLQKKLWRCTLALAAVLSLFNACKSSKPPVAQAPAKPAPRVLVFTKTKGWYHTSIPAGKAALQKLGAQNNFRVDTTADAAYFVEDSLKNYSAVVFLSTTLNVLDADQQVAFEQYIQAGGGYVGIHAAADTEYDWPWYNKLVGGYFASHPNNPNVRKAVVNVQDTTHVSTSFLPKRWERADEWYDYKSLQPGLHILANLDEASYEGGEMGDNHPIAWYHDFDGGRAFYTGGGHTDESFNEPLFLQHLLGGIQYAIGSNAPLNYGNAYAVKAPEDNRFTKTVLTNDLNEPMELTVAPDGRVFFTERAGKFYVYDPAAKQTKLLRDFPVKAVDKYLNGLIGITLDPDFKQNNFIYFFYSTNTGDQYHQNVSRFTIDAQNNLDTLSEKVIIKIPLDLEVSAHTGGSLAWDNAKNLYISTGDNTVPFESDGYAPIDEREGRTTFDAQRSAANPNDLRGKILRIHPESDGSYTIPAGNLFAKGTAGTRPEIYIMGCRNPYRISVDQATNILYWGEIGPDAGQDSRHGPRGYDEFNQAREAGNYGWPYFVGNSKAYHDSDFATKAVGDLFNAAAPVNNSPNNTGMHNLPPAQKAMVWYPYNASDEFPALGVGGRCAMGGPVYHYDAASTSTTKLPAYYDKALFVYDWMRNWVFAIRLDEQYNYQRMEPFMPSNGDFRRPVDMEIGPDGAIYMLEYGSVYGIDNVDARLVKIEYNGGNRAPIAQITTRDTIGLAPFTAKLNSNKSLDFDEDPLTYQWLLNGQPFSNEAAPSFTFANNGIYKAVLKVTDNAGMSSTDTVEIKVGNTLPQVVINTEDNSTFFFEKPSPLHYSVAVTDKEDATIEAKKVKVALKYIPKVAADAALIGHQQMDENYNLGQTLVASSDCKACHQLNAKSVGPSFMQVSKKYSNDKNAVGRLANKVITGGGGVWGEHAMNAHPQLSKEEATEIVKYVLSVANKPEEVALPQQGIAPLKEHVGTGEEGRYILTASYTDKGGAIVPLTSKDMLVLRPAKVQAENADKVYNMQRSEQGLRSIHNRSYFVIKDVDLKDITGITYRYAAIDREATIAVHTDAPNGPVVSSITYKRTGSWNTMNEVTAPVTDPGGKHDLYFVFTKKDEPNRNLANVDWVRFEGGKEWKGPTAPTVKEKTKPKVTTKKVTDAKPAATTTSTKLKGAVLIAKSDCAACHKPTQKLIGPSYADISKKYKNTPANVGRLAGKVISGGAGVWGKVPMTPHPQLSKAEAAAMVQHILSMK